MQGRLNDTEKAAFTIRYNQLAHAIQSAVKFHPDKKGQEAKHLRVGVDLRAVEHSALATVLMRKGIITEREYYEGLVDAMEEEVALREKELAEVFGNAIVVA